jgi:hypothetical protein
MAKNTQKAKEAVLATSFVAGIGKHFANAATMTFGSAALTPAELTSRFQTLVDLRKAVNDAKATTQAKLAAEVTQAPALLALMAEFETFVRVTFSKSPDVLADFGLAPRKTRTTPTVEQRAAAAAKSRATRAARHTMGKKQKRTVRGDVVGVDVTPVTAARSVVPATAPAAPAPAQNAGASATPGAAAALTPHPT